MNDWAVFDRDHVWHPYTQMLTAPAPIAVARAEGVYLYTDDGRRILDGISSWWVNIHGHSHPRLNRALAEQSRRLQQVIFAGCTHEPAARLGAKLVSLTPAGLQHVFYSDDGSTAVEVALKMAVQYWRNRGEEGRTLFVALDHAYHGDTFGAMAVGGVGLFQEAFESMSFDARRAYNPYSDGKDPRRFAGECVESIEEILRVDADGTAAVIIEPMLQGAGGMIVWPAEFLRRARELCNRYNVLLIADEVLTGFGRTGKLFACEHGPVTPDILCLSKAVTGGYLPLAATLCTEEVYNRFLSEDRRRTFFHGHSYTANALACAVALESLAIIEEENVLSRVRSLEALFRKRLRELRELPAVGDARSIGAVAALELSSPQDEAGEKEAYLDALGPRLSQEFLRRNLLLRPLGNVLYFMPPYVISDEEAHRVFDVIAEVVDALRA